MRVAILGANGQLGQECQLTFAEHELLCADLPEVNATERDSLFGALDRFKPEVLLNCAAFTAVDACETETELCWAVNETAPALMAEWCALNDAFMVQVSTDYVLAGNKPLFESADESEPTAPISAYGKSKLAGEEAVLKSGAKAAILRTAWLYGEFGKNFLFTMQSLSEQGKALKVINDQFGSPTWAGTLAQQMLTVVEKQATGVFHATSEGHCSWCDLAIAYLELMNIPYDITPCSTDEYPTPAKRPSNSILENKALKDAGINCFQDWQTELENFVTSLKG